MASLLIRHVDPALHLRLKASAIAHRRSLEEEARELLRVAVARRDLPPQETLTALAHRLFGADGGVEIDLPPRDVSAERATPDFSGSDYDSPAKQ